MKPSEKDFLLSQIAIVLSQLESLVSQLSSVQCQEESPAEDDVSSVYSQLSGSLSWDYSEDFPTLPVPSSFYSLLFPDSSDEEMEIPVKFQNVKKPIVKKYVHLSTKFRLLYRPIFPMESTTRSSKKIF